MAIITKVGLALQHLFGECAEQAAEATGVIERQRKFTAASLARTFVLGFLRHPDANVEQLAQTAVQCGAPVTPQAVDQRHTPRLVQFLKDLFGRATKVIVGSHKALAPLLERFASVTMLDSTTISLPDSLKEESPGCGAKNGGGAAAMKLQTEWDLRSGAITHIEIEAGRSPDAGTSRQAVRRGKGSLRISDLGYFNVAVFAEMTRAGEYFLSRLQFGTHVLLPQGEPVELLSWLAQQSAGLVDQPIRLGKQQRLACRLIAWRVPAEQANRRRQKLRQEMLSRKGKEPSAERLAWCDWTILVTNVPPAPGGAPESVAEAPAHLSAEEALVLYRARWQIELLFKRWKTQDRVAVLRGSTDVRQMVGVWSRLLAALVQHWLVIASAWGDPTKSLSKVSEAIREFVGRLAAALRQRTGIAEVLADLIDVVATTCRRNKRAKKPGTFEMLNDASLLDFDLT